jgi:hypothetical protein
MADDLYLVLVREASNAEEDEEDALAVDAVAAAGNHHGVVHLAHKSNTGD